MVQDTNKNSQQLPDIFFWFYNLTASDDKDIRQVIGREEIFEKQISDNAEVFPIIYKNYTQLNTKRQPIKRNRGKWLKKYDFWMLVIFYFFILGLVIWVCFPFENSLSSSYVICVFGVSLFNFDRHVLNESELKIFSDRIFSCEFLAYSRHLKNYFWVKMADN